MNTATTNVVVSQPTIKPIGDSKYALFEGSLRVSSDYSTIDPAVTGVVAGQSYSLFLATKDGAPGRTILFRNALGEWVPGESGVTSIRYEYGCFISERMIGVRIIDPRIGTAAHSNEYDFIVREADGLLYGHDAGSNFRITVFGEPESAETTLPAGTYFRERRIAPYVLRSFDGGGEQLFSLDDSPFSPVYNEIHDLHFVDGEGIERVVFVATLACGRSVLLADQGHSLTPVSEQTPWDKIRWNETNRMVEGLRGSQWVALLSRGARAGTPAPQMQPVQSTLLAAPVVVRSQLSSDRHIHNVFQRDGVNFGFMGSHISNRDLVIVDEERVPCSPLLSRGPAESMTTILAKRGHFVVPAGKHFWSVSCDNFIPQTVETIPGSDHLLQAQIGSTPVGLRDEQKILGVFSRVTGENLTIGKRLMEVRKTGSGSVEGRNLILTSIELLCLLPFAGTAVGLGVGTLISLAGAHAGLYWSLGIGGFLGTICSLAGALGQGFEGPSIAFSGWRAVVPSSSRTNVMEEPKQHRFTQACSDEQLQKLGFIVRPDGMLAHRGLQSGEAGCENRFRRVSSAHPRRSNAPFLVVWDPQINSHTPCRARLMTGSLNAMKVGRAYDDLWFDNELKLLLARQGTQYCIVNTATGEPAHSGRYDWFTRGGFPFRRVYGECDNGSSELIPL